MDTRISRWWPALAFLLAGTGLSAAAMYQVRRHNDAVLHESVERAAQGAAAQIGSRLQRYQYGLRGLRGAIAVAGVDRLDAAAFQRYSRTRDYAQEFPGARGFGFIRRVSRADEAAYLARMRQMHGPGFAIHELHPHDGERDVIEWIEPLASNRGAIGLDIASESARRAAAAAAMRDGAATLTGPITLVQTGGQQQQSFLLLLPVYRDDAAATPDNVAGWTYAPLVMDEVLARLAAELPEGLLTMEDVTAPGAPRRFHAGGVAAAGGAAALETMSIYGRRWRLTFRPAAAFIERQQLLAPGFVGAIGMLLTVLVCALGAMGQAYRGRQAGLRTTQAHLAAIVQSSADAIIGCTLDGIVTSWNEGAERLFGYTAAQATGHAVADLIVPAELRHEEHAILAAVRRDEPFRIMQTRRQRRDGSVFDVSMAVAPIRNDHGVVIGGSKTIRDMSALVAAHRAIAALNVTLERDVAQRTQDLDDARRTLRTVLDAVPAMIGYWDSKLVNRVANRAYAQFFGLDAEAIPGRAMREILDSALLAEIEPRVRAALRGEPQHFERRLVARDGSVHHFLTHYLPDSVGDAVAGFYVIAHDVSDLVSSRQALASALRENDVLVRTINEHLLYSVTDEAGIILEVNDNFCRALGYRREQLVGIDYSLIRAEENGPGFWAGMWNTIGAGRTWHGTVCNRSASGKLLWFDTVIAPYFDAQQKIERYVALCTDVTDRQAADAALRHLSALLSNVLRAASEMSIVATDVGGTISLFNTGAERMLGYAAAEMVGLASPLVFHDPAEVAARARELSEQAGQAVQGFAAFVHLASREGAETREWTYIRKDGSRLPVSLTVTAMRDDAGQVLGYVGVGIDISRRKRDEAALLHSMHLVEEASKAKSTFLANMSHEIRTPMNAVLGMLALARRTALSERQRAYLDNANGAGISLLGLLDDILDFSKIEAGKLDIEIQPFEMEDLLHALAVVLTGNNATKTVDVMFDVAPEVPAQLEGDRGRILQVLVNLAGNALKFTASGNVVVRIEACARTPATATLRFSVRDSGIGIAADQLVRIFDSFTQAEASTTRRFGGTGLGLSISSRLVGLMGGHLAVVSEPGKGSHFWFDLELGLPPCAAPVHDAVLENLRVLVVDDSRIAGEILVRMLQALGCRAHYLPDGCDTLRQVADARQAGDPFGVVLMDLRMPGMDGIQVAAALAGLPAAPPVIIVTAYVQDDLGARAGAAGAPDLAVLTKPMTAGALAKALHRALGGAPAEAPATAPAGGARLAGMRLLVVEDNQLNRQVASELLAAEGAAIDLAECGTRAIALATGPGRRYDAILMDIQMPDVDGLEATRRIRRAEQGARTPIVAMTANASETDRKDCLDAGMDAHIGKPFNIDEVVGVLCRACHLAAPSKPAAPAAGNDAELDVDGALLRFQGNARAYRRALAAFEQDAKERFGQLKRGAGAGAEADGAAAAMLHALKGLALTIGANGLARRIALAEPAVPAGMPEPPGLPPAAIDALEAHTATALRQMRAMLDSRAPEPAGGAPAPAPDPAQRSSQLADLLALLDSGNLRALDLADELDGGAGDPALAAALQAIFELRFEEAAGRLRAVLAHA